MSQAQQPAAWNVSDWNPQPDKKEDVILPLPCGGSMAFRAVRTSNARGGAPTYLDDRQVLLGGADEEIAVASSLRTDFVSGPFLDPAGARYYLLGKYEVTNQQYRAVMSASDCKAAAVSGSERPDAAKAGVSWFDAIDFTRRLNDWLYATHAAALPKADGSPGFVRLPSEAEWEFAARGGMAVSEAERGNPTFVPSGADLADYAWFADPRLSGKGAQPIGALKPNPLGLFDMLGNVEEIVLDPFRLNRAGRLHGQPGGMIVRGGSYLTSKQAMRDSTRTELPLFDAAGKSELRSPQVGFRVAIGALALTSPAEAKAVQNEWEALRKSTASSGETDALQILQRLLRDTPNPEERRDLRDVLAQIGQERRLRSELEARAIRGVWSHAVTVRGNVMASARELDDWQKVIDEPDPSGAGATRKRVAMERLGAERSIFNTYLASYLDLVTQLATGFQNADILAEARLLRREFEEVGDKAQVEHLDQTMSIVTRYRQSSQMRNTRAMRDAIVGARPWLR